jgi:Malectin domain
MSIANARVASLRPLVSFSLLTLALLSSCSQGNQPAPQSTGETVATATSNLTSAPGSDVNTLMFHGDPQRTGWRKTETVLTPANVSKLMPIWNSPQFDLVGGQTPHLYASPLYVDSVTLSSGPLSGKTFSVVFAATSNGFVYAVNAFTTADAQAGTILWKSNQLGTPSVPVLNSQNTPFDGGVHLGVLGTPVIDLTRNRLYVASADSVMGAWLVCAIDITSGNVLWKLPVNNNTIASVMKNGPATMQPISRTGQRGSLGLDPSGGVLYVPFGAYGDQGAGFMVTVDTAAAKLVAAFAGTPDGRPSLYNFANGGMWASGGAAFDTMGNVFITTGNGVTGHSTALGWWGQSVLEWQGGTTSAQLNLIGTYTPWNQCQMDTADIDLAGGAPIVVPDLPLTSTPHTLAFGGKQGNVYLLDRDHMPGALDRRQGCNTTDSSLDKSLLPPASQPQPPFGKRGPLNVFRPYSDTQGNMDYAKSRATPAYFNSGGADYLFVAGSSKQQSNPVSCGNKCDLNSSTCPCSQTSVPPGLARLRIVTASGSPAYLSVEQYENTLTFNTPGSPVITSKSDSSDAILWILVANVLRSTHLTTTTITPTLYAIDPITFSVLWHSTPSQLHVGGKYNSPTIARGVAFVGTDRIQAFGLPPSVTDAGTPDASDAGSVVDADATASGDADASSADADATSGMDADASSGMDADAAAPIQINSGGPTVGTFVADVDFSGGTTINHANTIDLSGVTNPAPMAVYQEARVGTFSYTIGGSAPSSSHKVRLHFAETFWTANGQRTFNVSINGTSVLTAFDIFKTAGARNKAVIEEFVENADTSGNYLIQFTAVVDKALISGIEIQ